MHPFDYAHIFVARWEGGFVNHPSDPGGATNYGVSLRWLRSIGLDVDGDGDVDIDDIKALTPELSKDLFCIHFWQACHCDALPPLCAVALYDAAVNMGPGRAASQMQRACNRLQGARLVVDGDIGPRTLARATEIGRNPEAELLLCRKMIDEREEFYRRLASEARFRPFLRGWLNRSQALRGYIAQLRVDGVL